MTQPYPEPPLRDYEPIQPRGTDWRGIARKIWAPVAALVAFLVKFGGVLFKLKFFTVIGSMIVSAGVYVWIGGWWFGVGLVALIFVHEMGHALEAKRQGLKVSAPMFIPFFGAMILLKEMPPNAWREAQIALAGPVVGSLGAAAVWVAGEAYDSRPLQALAFIGFFINLFNLLPAGQLDGGRAVGAIHPSLRIVGFVGLVALVLFRPNPILIFILILAAMDTWNRWRGHGEGEAPGYYSVKPWQRAVVAVTYFGLAVLLVVGMEATHVDRDF